MTYRCSITRRFVSLCALSAALWPASRAFAAGGGEDSAGSTLVVVALICTVGVAYLVTHFVLDHLQRRVLMISGVEYILLGILLGPHVPLEIPAFENIDSLLPVVALAVGWVGLLRGMELSLNRIRANRERRSTRVVLVTGLVAGGLTGAAGYAVFATGLFTELPRGSGAYSPEPWMAAGVMACAAVAGSLEPIELLHRRYRLEGPLSELVRRLAAMSDLLAILVFGLLFCIFHPLEAGAVEQPSPTEWAVVTLALGALLGVLFTPFLGEDDSENGRFLALMGIIVLASGAAYFLDLSPLLVNLCLGVVLVNTARQGSQIQKTLEGTKKPMSLVLFVFAGALWRPPELVPAIVVALGYVVLRLLSKAAGTHLASLGTEQRGDVYRGLLAHGEVSVAMAVSLRLVYEGPAIDLAYTAILVSVIANDLLAPRILRGLLVDTGDLRGEREEEPG